MTKNKFGSRFYEDTGRVITIHTGEYEEELTQNEVVDILNEYDLKNAELLDENNQLIAEEFVLRDELRWVKKENQELKDSNEHYRQWFKENGIHEIVVGDCKIVIKE